MLCVGVWKEGITCRLRASQLGWDLEPGKKVHVVFKQEKKTIIIAFIEHLLVPGTLHTSVLIIPTTTWEVGIIITIL